MYYGCVPWWHSVGRSLSPKVFCINSVIVLFSIVVFCVTRSRHKGVLIHYDPLARDDEPVDEATLLDRDIEALLKSSSRLEHDDTDFDAAGETRHHFFCEKNCFEKKKKNRFVFC